MLFSMLLLLTEGSKRCKPKRVY